MANWHDIIDLCLYKAFFHLLYVRSVVTVDIALFLNI